MKKVKVGLLLATLCAASLYAQEISAEEAAPEVVAADSVKTPEPVPQLEPAPVPAVILPIVVAASEPNNIRFHLGTRLGLGISAMRKHIALQILRLKSVQLYPAFSLGAGIATAIEFNSLFTLAPELQYTWYRANGEFVEGNGKIFQPLHEAGVSLHSFELPILARFNFGSFYAEVGPQIGLNCYAKTYTDSDNQKPDIDVFAVGPSAGFGMNIDNSTLIGLRGHFGLLEYAEKTNGKPWVAQVSVTKFFF